MSAPNEETVSNLFKAPSARALQRRVEREAAKAERDAKRAAAEAAGRERWIALQASRRRESLEQSMATHRAAEERAIASGLAATVYEDLARNGSLEAARKLEEIKARGTVPGQASAGRWRAAGYLELPNGWRS